MGREILEYFFVPFRKRYLIRENIFVTKHFENVMHEFVIGTTDCPTPIRDIMQSCQ